jgi:uncharacterized NAD(P)/FAD-binding protein YdhS
MVDMVRSLYDRGHQGRIIVVSTHGKLPAEHCFLADEYPPFGGTIPADSTSAVNLVKRNLRQAKAVGIGWQAVIDALRLDTASWWQAFSLAEQHRFLRHLGHRWNIVRHRMPPESGQIIRKLLDQGQLHLLPGRVNRAESHSDGIRCTVECQGRKKREEITARV